MKDQHKHIKGYRDLSKEEIDLINKVKQKGLELQDLITELDDLRYNSTDLTLDKVESKRCRDLAMDNLQTGMMWLIRSIALPQGF